MIKIDSISSYIEVISKLDIIENIYFRGQNNSSFDLTPGIYRKDSKNLKYTHLENENLMYRDIISKSPSDFINKNTLESLTLMQHYGLPTRILDITSNALVALYFACINNYETNGKVYVFHVENESIVDYNSDRACILANLAKTDYNFSFNSKMYTYIYNFIKELEPEQDKWMAKSLDISEDYDYILEFLKTKKFDYERGYNNEGFNQYLSNNWINKHRALLLEEIREKYSDIDFYDNNVEIYVMLKVYTSLLSILYQILEEKKDYLNNNFFGKLIDFVREDKAYFIPRINPLDLESVYLVKPKLDNARIVRQQGAFFIYGVNGNNGKKGMPKINDKWIIKEILIDFNAKERMIKELESLGISEITLFPEIDYVAKHIRNKYSV